MKTPKVSFIICTLNCKQDLERCLKSIRAQDYPQNKVEIVVVDSYSTDGTIEVAKEYKSTLLLTKIRGYMEGKGMPKSMGCEKASGEIIITLDSDNALVEKDWIRKMIHPLLIDKEVNFCISRMAVVPSDPLINQYLSMVGTDPFAIYTSVDPQISLKNLKLQDKGKYYTYTLTPENFLIVGGYYLTMRKSTLKEIGGYSRDVDVAFSLAQKGMGTFAIPKQAHLHHEIAKKIPKFLKQKVKWSKFYFDNPQLQREFNWSQGLFGVHGKVRFIYEVLRNFLFFPAFFQSISLALSQKQKAWLLHAPLKFGTTFAYVIAFLKSR
tara:strand:- start:9765 stop:10733 length:969 start_codon:yes stop_codon:yes gene_type:complete